MVSEAMPEDAAGDVAKPDAASTVAVEAVRGERIAPDASFVREVQRRGGESARKCFQCGTCSVSCEIGYSRSNAGFPRKVMLWTQWGLRDRALNDPSIWLCHQCNDCSANCPRGAKPGDVLGALRSMAIERMSAPGFVSRLFSEPRWLPVVFGVPAAILLLLVAIFQGFNYPAGEIEYDRFISDTAIEIAGFIVAGYAVVVAVMGILRFWRQLRLSGGAYVPLPGEAASRTEPVTSLGSSLAGAGTDIALHSDFRECKTDRLRMWGHLAVFYGAPFLLAATALAATYSFIGQEVQRPLTDPTKLLGNLGAILLFGGLAAFVYNRLRARKGTWGRGSYADWLLLSMIGLLVVTGVVLEIVRYMGLATVAYSLYLVHLDVVFAAFVYAPHGKFAHIFYRATAMAFGKYTGLVRPVAVAQGAAE